MLYCECHLLNTWRYLANVSKPPENKENLWQEQRTDKRVPARYSKDSITCTEFTVAISSTSDIFDSAQHIYTAAWGHAQPLTHIFDAIFKCLLGQRPWSIHNSSVIIRAPAGRVNVDVGAVEAEGGCLYCVKHVSIQHPHSCPQHHQILQHPTSTCLHMHHHIQTLEHPHTCTQKITTFKHFNTQHPHSCTQNTQHHTAAHRRSPHSNTSTPNIHTAAQHQKITTFKHFNTKENQSPHSNISTPNTCTQKITFKCFNTQQPHTCTQTTTFKPFNTHTPAHRPPHSNTWTPTHLLTKDHIQTLQHPTATHLHTDHHIQTLQHPHTCTQATTFKYFNTQQPHTCTLVSMWGGAGGGHMRCHSGREHAEKGFRKNKDQSWKKGGPWSVIHFIWKYITKERLHCIFINGTTVFSSEVPLYFLLKVLLYVCQRHHCIFITKATVLSSKVLLSFHQRCYCIFIKVTTVFFIKGATILSSKVPLFIKCATVFLPEVPPFIKCATVFSSMVPPYFHMHPSQY